MQQLIKPLLLCSYFVSFALLFSIFQFTILYPSTYQRGALNLLQGPLVFSFIFAEYLLLSIGLIVLDSRSHFIRGFSYALIAALFAIQCAQFLSLYFSGDYLNPGIFIHAELFSLLVTPFTLATVIVPLVILLPGYIYFRRWAGLSRFNKSEKIWGSGFLFILLIVGLVLNNNLTSMRVLKLSYKAGEHSPVRMFIRAATDTHRSETSDPTSIALSPEELAISQSVGISLDPSTSRPFFKNTVFKLDPYQLSNRDSQPPNVIVFFVESLSARLTSVYRDDLPGLTPHLLDFASSSTHFNNYYNHVTPTIVGIRGQLCSMFPRLQHSDWQNAKFRLQTQPFRCLPHILSDTGYDTFFFGYSHPNTTFFRDQIKETGVQRSYFFQDFLDQYVDKQQRPLRRQNGNGDAQMLTGLTNFLQHRQPDKPFFVAVSTIETHPGLDIIEDQVPYLDGSNAKLNMLHNFDRAFGDFWSDFKQSPWFENTIVVVTADHAHTPSVLLKEVAGLDYPNEHFDTIAMLLRDPKQKLPAQMDVFSSSLDLAPSLLQLLGIRNEANSFMGLSLFGDRQQYPKALGLMYNTKLSIADKNQYQVKSLSPEACSPPYQESLCALYNTIRYSHYLQFKQKF
jgi:hypothetical protein